MNLEHLHSIKLRFLLFLVDSSVLPCRFKAALNGFKDLMWARTRSSPLHAFDPASLPHRNSKKKKKEKTTLF